MGELMGALPDALPSHRVHAGFATRQGRQASRRGGFPWMAWRQQNGTFASLSTISAPAGRQEANRLAKEQRKAQAQSTMKAERASKDEKLHAGIVSANALGQPRSSDDP